MWRVLTTSSIIRHLQTPTVPAKSAHGACSFLQNEELCRTEAIVSVIEIRDEIY